MTIPTRPESVVIEVPAIGIEDWNKCPQGHIDIQGGGVEIDGIYAWQEIVCSECGLEWTEVYEAKRRQFLVTVNG